MNILKLKPLQVLGATILIGAATQPVLAQRDPADRGQQRAERRERMENATPEQRAQMRQQWQQRRQQREQNMTPQQRAQRQQRQQQREVQRQASEWDWVRQTLAASGYKDAPMQNAVIAFMQAQERAREPLREQARTLAESLVNPAVPDAQLSTNLAAFRTAMATDATRHDSELAALDQAVKYSTQPRLEMLMTVLGVVGPETPTLGGVGALFPESPMAGGGGGRGRGGMRGGPDGG